LDPVALSACTGLREEELPRVEPRSQAHEGHHVLLVGTEQLSVPSALLVSDEHLYVADRSRGRVVAFDSEATEEETAPKLVFKPWSLTEPSGLAVARGDPATADPYGSVFVADAARHSVLRWDGQQSQKWSWATVVAGGRGEGQRADQLSYPSAIAVDGDALYVCEKGNHRVTRWTPGKAAPRSWRYPDHYIVLGGRGRGTGLHQLDSPQGLAVGRGEDGGLVVAADTGNHRVLRAARDGSWQKLVAGAFCAAKRAAGCVNKQLRRSSFGHFCKCIFPSKPQKPFRSR
jgi:sugar lactone lactonase YvrE